MARSGDRLGRLQAAIDEHDRLDCLLITAPFNARYLSGFTGSNATLVVAPGSAALLTDFRYLEQAEDQAPGFEIVDGGSEPRQRLLELLAGFRSIGFDETDMRVKQYQGLTESLAGGVELAPASGLVERLREVKDEQEIAAIAAAASIADSIYATLAEEGLTGRSERAIAWRIATLAHERGGDGLSFDPIVAAGAHGALPHAEPRERAIEAGELVVLDFGVIKDGYCSDCTRTFATGPIGAAESDAYELVLAAQQAALDGVLAGASCKAVDAIARDLIAEAGMGERFGHSLGHGVGLEVHELPTLSGRSEGVLTAGNVVTVEPGVYIPGQFGIRIEDLAVVTGAQPQVLTPFTKQLLTTD